MATGNAATFIEKDPTAEAPVTSVALRLNVYEPVLPAEPEIAPAARRVMPSGSEPPASVHVKGGAPPAAERVCEYGLSTTVSESEPPGTFSGGGRVTAKGNEADQESPLASFAVTAIV